MMFEVIITQKMLALAVIPIILAILLKLHSWIRAVLLALTLPGPVAYPVIGNLPQLKKLKNINEFTKNLYERYGSLFRLWIGPFPAVVVLDPKDIDRIMSSFRLQSSYLYNLMLHMSVRTELLTAAGLKTSIKVFSECADNAIKQLEGENETLIVDRISSYVRNVLHRMILGIPIDEYDIKLESPFNKDLLKPLLQTVLKDAGIPDFFYNTFFANDEEKTQKTGRECISRFLKKIVEKRERDKEQNIKLNHCFLTNLLELQSKIPQVKRDKDDEMSITNEIALQIIYGYEPIITATEFALYYLAKHQEIQDKVFQELNDVLSSSDSFDLNSLNNLMFLEQCILETLRLCPPIPIIGRKLVEDVKLDKHVLPSGCTVLMSPYATHRLPQHYTDPEVFNPDRFFENNKKNIHKFAYIPFRTGPQNCIGNTYGILQMKMMIAKLLKKYKISISLFYSFEVRYRTSLKPDNSVLLKLKRRD